MWSRGRPRRSVLLGRTFDQHSVIGPMLAKAMAEGKPVASDPIPLLRQNGPVGIVLAAPVVHGRRVGAGRLHHIFL